MSRLALRSLARWLAALLVLAQIAVSAYACPTSALAGTGHAQRMVAVDEDASAQSPSIPATDCSAAMGQTDPAFPNLCAEHCKADRQSDPAPALIVPLAWPTALYAIPPPPRARPLRRPPAVALDALVANARPHAIVHCVRRT